MMPSRLASLRENPATARAGMRWSESEDAELMERAVQGMDINAIAKAHMRTIGGVKVRIMTNALAMMERDGMTLEEASVRVHIPLEDLEEYKLREDEKQEKAKKRPDRDDGDGEILATLREIRDLLRVITHVSLDSRARSGDIDLGRK